MKERRSRQVRDCSQVDPMVIARTTGRKLNYLICLGYYCIFFCCRFKSGLYSVYSVYLCIWVLLFNCVDQAKRLLLFSNNSLKSFEKLGNENILSKFGSFFNTKLFQFVSKLL